MDKVFDTWNWPEERWRGILEHVRAGRSLRPTSWANNARCAVALSFDSDHESYELRDGGKSISALSQGQFGPRQGTPRIRALLDRYYIKSTFFVPAVSAMLYPDEQRGLTADGHEIALHGWIHERNTLLDGNTERDLQQLRAADKFEEITGVRPIGIRTPSWDFSAHTLQITKDMGLLYDSSLMADVDCYELMMHGEFSGVVELPVEWIRDDAAYLIMDRWGSLRPQIAPADVLGIFIPEFDAAYAEGGVFQLTMHPDTIGHRSRIWLLEELIRHIRSNDGVWFATHADAVRHAKQHAI
ncbi:MAG: polysaccharide deacetylase [Mesorhizobium sp.]|uniref:polysaccharide deacetylase family protein n=1 Tax=Mesorhizobium sp. TaxID=1871066 RepID=UPI000FE39BE7|nr:polysaccharide deacetylase [Mesorhizobium sp.]RWG80881.1 MAG: polysaccharide deacetylase [Mesorhizobium sp.]RWI44247.1 MAG: polysaccharide deacetylase [Mesorhizobium sp.]RWJ25250.1 MAG: polysaccharide deacetylase [Mesorhizobium sp.]RWJ89664.1 MAG: polysaccharide deacetylase [Mesorhizobium sp.]RWK15044.1 MAG: polysaccharide deacetylase [Mesorhizobium sp.]